MRAVADVSTDDLVNSLLDSVTSGSSAPPESSTPTDATVASNSTTPIVAHSVTATPSASSSGSSGSEDALPTDTPNSIAPITPEPAAITTPPVSPDDSATKGLDTKSGKGHATTSLSLGISLGVLALVFAILLLMRSRRRHVHKDHDSNAPSAAGLTPMTVPPDRGFKRERELGLPEMSIELAPGELGMTKGFEMSCTSSTRSSVASQHLSVASSGSGLFNTKGGVSPTSSNLKLTSYSYQYRESEEKGNGNNMLSTAGGTTYHLTGLIGNGATINGSGPSNRSRKLSTPDEYAELISATNAQDKVNMGGHDRPLQRTYGNFAHSDMDISMGPDEDTYAFIAPLPPKAPSPQILKISKLTNSRASEESMCPDSPVAKRGKNQMPSAHLNGENRPTSSQSSSGSASVASFMTRSSVSSISTGDSMIASACDSAYLPTVHFLQQLARSSVNDYGEDLTPERASTESTDSANTARSGSLIALNLDAKDGSEIAI